MESVAEYSVEDEINDVGVNRPHVVILGAGASLAAFLEGDRNGKHLPLMTNFIETVGLGPILDKHDISFAPDENFEDLYSRIHAEEAHVDAVREVETVVHTYFSSLELPDCPTIYDHLVLSLRQKDIIATFNWDPFLYEACERNYSRVKSIPHVVFLHGSVAVGVCAEHRMKGAQGESCSVCGEPYVDTRLLYPVTEKNYTNNKFIQAEWAALQSRLKRGYLLTIFGYGAPKSDVEAIKLMHQAWGTPEERSLEEIEVIDIRSEDQLRDTWSQFIHSHHYEVNDTFYDSWIAKHPRRSCEAAIAQFIDAKFIDENPLPIDAAFPDLWAWFGRLTDVEDASGI